MGKAIAFPIFFCTFIKKKPFLTKGKSPLARLIGVDKMLNAFTMHYFFSTMPSKIAVTMPFGTGAFLISTQKTYLIHLFINQINSL
jgi:hypothetical protein